MKGIQPRNGVAGMELIVNPLQRVRDYDFQPLNFIYLFSSFFYLILGDVLNPVQITVTSLNTTSETN